MKNPDSALVKLEKFYKTSLAKEDTLRAVNALMELAWTYGHQANYKETYDKLWTALLLADAAHLDLKRDNIYRSIGRYYSFYNRK